MLCVPISGALNERWNRGLVKGVSIYDVRTEGGCQEKPQIYGRHIWKPPSHKAAIGKYTSPKIATTILARLSMYGGEHRL